MLFKKDQRPKHFPRGLAVDDILQSAEPNNFHVSVNTNATRTGVQVVISSHPVGDNHNKLVSVEGGNFFFLEDEHGASEVFTWTIVLLDLENLFS